MHAVTPLPQGCRLAAEDAPHGDLRPLAGRTALVTGSTRGIGEGIARALAEAGCNLVLNGRSSSPDGEPPAQAIATNRSVEARYSSADLRKRSHVERLVAFSQAQFGANTLACPCLTH